MICYDCGHPIEDGKPHNHNTFVIINNEKQALKDGEKIGAFSTSRKMWAKSVPVIVVVTQNESE